MILFSLLWIGTLVYAITLYRIGSAFRRNIATTLYPATEVHASFSIVVPFRNEEQNLPALVHSIAALNYPAHLLEILFVNDHSSDNSTQLLTSSLPTLPFHTQLLHNEPENSGKKPALQIGIQEAKHAYILTTDADCVLPPDLLLLLNHATADKNVAMVAGPVVYSGDKNSPLSQYQIIENAGLIVMAAYGISQKIPFMANGANLCFKKEIYDDVSGYEGNLHIPGGDDEYLLEKVHTLLPGSVVFLYEQQGIVRTNVQPDFDSFVQQRVRWAAKAKHKKKKSVFLLQSVLLLLFAGILASFLFVPVLPSSGFVLLAPCIKLLADLVFYYQMRPFFSLDRSPKFVLVSSIIQLFWIPWIAFKSIRGNYGWKDRSYGF